MNQADHSDIADAPRVCSPEVSAQIASLRAAGADQFDPVRLHYIDALARRAMAHQGNVRRILDIKLAHVLAVFEARFEQAQSDARETVARTAPQYPHAAGDLQRFFAAGDFNGLRRSAAALTPRQQRTSLGALVRRLEQPASATIDARLEVNTGSRPELKTLRNFRNTWSKLSTGKQVTQALEQAPKNAGPINSHMLVLRSLALMRDISPDYLNRFMSYADALLCLDQGEKEKPANAKRPPVARASKKGN